MKTVAKKTCFALLVVVILITSLAFVGCKKNDVAEEKVEPTPVCVVDENNPFDEATGTLYFSDEMLEEIGEPSYLEEYKCASYEINEHYFLNRDEFEKQIMKSKVFVVSKDNPTFYTRNGALYRKENNELAFCPPAYEGEFYIDADVNSINYRAFEGCFNITGFVVDESNEKYMDKDGILYSKDESILYAYPAKRQGELVISPATQKVSAVLCSAKYFLKDKAYGIEDHGLEKIVVEDRNTLLNFEGFTFFDCPNLKEVQYNFSESKYDKLITVDEVLMRETVKESFVEVGTKVFCTLDTTYIVKNGEAFAFGAEDEDRFLPVVSNALKISCAGLDCYLDNDHNLHLTDSENREEVIDNVSDIVDDIGGDRRVFLKDSQAFYVDANDLGEFNNDYEPIRIEGLPEGEIVDIHSWYNKMYVLYAGGEVRLVEWPIKKKDGIKVSNPFEDVSSFKAELKNFVDSYYQFGFAIIDENDNLYFVEYDTNTVTLEVENVRDAFCGEASKYYILNDGSLWGCGWNKYGQLGVGDKQNRAEYVKIMDGVRSITGGWTHVVVVTEDDRVFGFGENFEGQLSGKTKMYVTPVEMKKG